MQAGWRVRPAGNSIRSCVDLCIALFTQLPKRFWRALLIVAVHISLLVAATEGLRLPYPDSDADRKNPPALPLARGHQSDSRDTIEDRGRTERAPRRSSVIGTSATPTHRLAAQRCFHHETREAVARCPGCSRFFCRECVVEHDDRLFCSDCLKHESAGKGGRNSRTARFLTPVGVLGGVLLAWMVFYWLGQLLLLIPDEFQR
jgi:hypothetical protein